MTNQQVLGANIIQPVTRATRHMQLDTHEGPRESLTTESTTRQSDAKTNSRIRAPDPKTGAAHVASNLLHFSTPAQQRRLVRLPSRYVSRLGAQHFKGSLGKTVLS